MKFTKTAVALAVAAVACAPMMASATTTLSGLVQVKIQGNDEDGDAGDPNIAAGDVLFGITSEHTMNNGLTGYGSLRLDLDRLSNQTNDDGEKTAGSADSVYAGVKGGFGDLRFGEIPLGIEYGQFANDIYDHIIIDGPPVLGLADAQVLGNLTEATIVTVEAGNTRKTALLDGLKRLERANANMIGTVLNRNSRSANPDYNQEYYSYARKTSQSQKSSNS